MHDEPEVVQPPLRVDPDEDDVLVLTEVAPSPVDDSPVELREEYFSDSSKPSTTSTLGLGGHGLGYYLLRAQKYSSYAFTVFATMHITNTSLIPLVTKSVPESSRSLLLTRTFYQSALTEPLLVGIPLLVHVSSGIALRFYRRRQALRRYGAETHQDKRKIPWPSISGTSLLGYSLVPLASFHVLTTRLIPIYMHGDSSLIGLSYISHGFALHPFVSFAGFTALVGIGAWHAIWGWSKWLGLSPAQVTEPSSRRHKEKKKKRWYGINFVSAIIAGLWLAGGLGVVARGGKTDGWIGKEYDELYRSMPILGRWH